MIFSPCLRRSYINIASYLCEVSNCYCERVNFRKVFNKDAKMWLYFWMCWLNKWVWIMNRGGFTTSSMLPWLDWEIGDECVCACVGGGGGWPLSTMGRPWSLFSSCGFPKITQWFRLRHLQVPYVAQLSVFTSLNGSRGAQTAAPPGPGADH